MDAMSGVSIKTINLVKDLMHLHPSVCMLDGRAGIAPSLKLTSATAIGLNCWLNEKMLREKGMIE